MAEKQVHVTFQPAGRRVAVLVGVKVLEAAGRAGLTLATPCGGQGVCGKCRVQVTAGACPPTDADRAAFGDAELAEGWRLACQTRICDEAVITIPHGSLFADAHQIVTDMQAATELAPAVRKVLVRLPGDAAGGRGQALPAVLGEQLGAFQADPAVEAELAALAARGETAVTAVLTDGRLIAVEPGDTTGACYGVAVDVGTTTLAAVLANLRSGEELAIASAVNPQRRYGDDVLSRIKHAGTPGGAEQLRQAVVEAVNGLIARLAAQTGIERRSICELAAVGNTTMQHLLCGVDVTSLGVMPFAPARTDARLGLAAELGLDIHPRGAAYVFPVIGGFVGGDTVAGVLSSRLAERSGATLMVDIGTNGEIVLACDGRMETASTAAGPAFEGARISCGMAATPGAIERVTFDDDLRCGVIGDVAPAGLCGSGLIDLAAELLRANMLTPQGRLLPREELPAEVPPALAERVHRDADGRVYFLLAATDGPPIALTQADVRQLQLATAAIRAGVTRLLARAGLTAAELQAVIIAGGFGSFIRRSNAQRIGLLPAEVEHPRIHYIGNAALAGATWALLSTALRAKAETLARSVRHVELNRDAEFQNAFTEAITFPER